LLGTGLKKKHVNPLKGEKMKKVAIVACGAYMDYAEEKTVPKKAGDAS